MCLKVKYFEMEKNISIFLISLLFSLTIAFPLNNNDIEQEEIENSLDTDNYIDLTQFGRDIYGTPDTNTGDILSKWTPDLPVNPEELGSYLEGDILIPPSNGTRNGLISRSSRWPNGIVPYVIEGDFNSNQLELMKRGMEEYHSKTCIRFKPRTYERDYIAIVNDGSGCWSSVGRIGGRQEINLQTPGCLIKVGTFVHEVMHALGFLHEQNRYERDSYVSIMWDNIMSGTRINFNKASPMTTSGYGIPYDYGSVMHYSAYAFSRNGQPTIIPKQNIGRDVMGQRNAFSSNDIEKINAMYDCDPEEYSSLQWSLAGSSSTSPSSSNTSNNNNKGETPFLNFISNLINNFINRNKDKSDVPSNR